MLRAALLLVLLLPLGCVINNDPASDHQDNRVTIDGGQTDSGHADGGCHGEGPIDFGDDGGPVDFGDDGGPVDFGNDGGPIDFGDDGGPVDFGDDGGPVDFGDDGGPIDFGDDGGIIDGGLVDCVRKL